MRAALVHDQLSDTRRAAARPGQQGMCEACASRPGTDSA